MKKLFVLTGIIAAVVILSGCASTGGTVIYDPAVQRTDMVARGTVSAGELRDVAREAINGALTNPRFKAFLASYKAEKNDPNAIPVMKLSAVRNDTDDPDLKIGQLTDLLEEALINSGIVDVSKVEGADLDASIGRSRDLEDDDNFDQKTVAQRGTLVAARIALRPKVISSEVREGRTIDVTRTFVLEMIDIKTGSVMWKFTKQIGFVKTRARVGY
ncbi:MAG: hypothetical protein J6X49_05285 [Victivallales bacterium]|nr:hypothetical protein [Victivallales bacterium]